MIVSYRHHFIFVKTRKTGSSSIEIALSPLCGPRDVLTPLALEDERLRMHGRCPARNFYNGPWLESAYRKAVVENNAVRHRRMAARVRKEGLFYNHMPAAAIRQRVSPDFWRSAFKFAVERHPYEKAVSMAYYRLWQRGLPADRLPEVLDDVIARNEIDDAGRYMANGEVIVDRILRQENLAHDFADVCARLGVSFDGELPRAKAGIRLDNRPAAELLSAVQKEIIAANCATAMALLGYAP